VDRLLGVSWLVAGSVIIATVAIYLTVIVLVRVAGQRSLANMSAFDLGCVAALGAVIGRTMLLATPTLLSGVIVVVTLFVLQALLRALRRNPAVDRWFHPMPVVLMDGAAMLPDNLRRAHVSADDLRQALRLAGITRLDQLAYVVLERNGQISVLRSDDEFDPALVADLQLAVTASSG
jgi:uncharacterized membrane protein YcaP (DUF421 family)